MNEFLRSILLPLFEQKIKALILNVYVKWKIRKEVQINKECLSFNKRCEKYQEEFLCIFHV